MVDGEEDGEFSEKQYASYNTLKENWGLFSKVFYDVSYNEKYPLIESNDQLLESIMLVGIFVPSARYQDVVI